MIAEPSDATRTYAATVLPFPYAPLPDHPAEAAATTPAPRRSASPLGEAAMPSDIAWFLQIRYARIAAASLASVSVSYMVSVWYLRLSTRTEQP